jgi:hypothetical protein
MDKTELLTDRVTLNTAEVPIEGVGTITVRGLSRFELLVAEKKYPDDNLKKERFILSTAVVDPAGLTESDVEKWQKASGPMEINAVADMINKLSGIGKGAEKSAVPTNGERAGV